MCLCNQGILSVVTGQLKANNPLLMEQAVQAMQNLSQQCSDPSAVEEVVKHLFNILGGQKRHTQNHL